MLVALWLIIGIGCTLYSVLRYVFDPKPDIDTLMLVALAGMFAPATAIFGTALAFVFGVRIALKALRKYAQEKV